MVYNVRNFLLFLFDHLKIPLFARIPLRSTMKQVNTSDAGM